MIWKRYAVHHTAIVTAGYGSQILDCKVEIGEVLTGKTRTHSGYYCRITAPDFDERAEAGSVHHAVIKAVGRLSDGGIEFDVYAGRPDFHESGLSQNTGWGYVRDVKQPVLMIDKVGTVRDRPWKNAER